MALVMDCHFDDNVYMDCAGDKELGVSPVKKKKKTRNESTRVDVYHEKTNLSPISAKKDLSQNKLVCAVPCHSLTKRVTSNDLKRLFVSTKFLLFLFSLIF